MGYGVPQGGRLVFAPADGAVDVPRQVEIRLSLDGWLDPATITTEAIVLRTGAVRRTTVLRWDFQAGADFENTVDDEPPHQVVAIRATTPLDPNVAHRVQVTDVLRGLFGEHVQPFEATFTTSDVEGSALPSEPPESPPDVAPLIEGSLWRPPASECAPGLAAESAPCQVSCGWMAGPCHRMIDPEIDLGTSHVDYGFTGAAMDLLLCNIEDQDGNGLYGCSAVFEAEAPLKDLYDFSSQWPTFRIVDPGRPEYSYVLYKILGVPGIDGVAMPGDAQQDPVRPYIAPHFDVEGADYENRSNFVGVAQGFRAWIAAGARQGEE